jgi:hypothetical protein
MAQLAPAIHLFGVHQLPDWPLALPFGISFFTFHALSYLIDVYRRDVKAERNLLALALYITMFPQLIAGPIVRFKTIVGELHGRRETMDGVAEGIRIFVIGLAQKTLIANTLALPADRIFALPTDMVTAPVAWIGAIAYSLQLYFDFCGYSLMAMMRWQLAYPGKPLPIVGHLLHEKFAQSRIAQRTAVHVVGGEFPPLLAQGSGRGGNELFYGDFVRVVVSTNEVVRWKSAPRLGAGGQVFGEQLGIVETRGSHTCLLSCGSIDRANRIGPAVVQGQHGTPLTGKGRTLGLQFPYRDDSGLSILEPSLSTGFLCGMVVDVFIVLKLFLLDCEVPNRVRHTDSLLLSHDSRSSSGAV